MTRRKSPPVPAHLGEQGRKLWRRLVAQFELDDAASQELLEKACVAADRAAQAREVIARDGITFTNAAGAPVRHPAVVVERDAIAAIQQAFKLLQLTHAYEGAGRRPGT